MYPEFKLPPGSDEGLAGRSAGRRRRPDDLADRFGWKIGDRDSAPRRRSGRRKSGDGPGSSTSSASTTASAASTRRSSSSATTTSTRTGAFGEGVGRLVHRPKIADPSQAVELGAEVRRDVRELVGGDEDDDREGLRRQLRQADRQHRGDRHARSSPPCSSCMLLVAANTMAQSVRERTNELGVLKTLGFTDTGGSGPGARRVGLRRGARRRPGPAGRRG